MRPPDDHDQQPKASEREEAKAFPPGYEEVETMVRQAEDRIRQIKEQIAKVPPDQPAPAYRPPGFLSTRQPGSQQRLIAGWESQKAQVRADAMHQVDQATTDADPTVREEVMQTATHRLSGREKDADAERQQQAITGKARDLNASQEWAMKKLDQRSAPEGQATAPEVSSAPTPNEQAAPPSMSLRFSQTLSYTKHTQTADKTPEKAPEPERAQHEPERD